MAVLITLSPPIADALGALTPAALRDELHMVLRDSMLIIESNVKQRTPVRTGALRRSWTSRVIGTAERGIVGTNLHYAPKVERRRGMAAQGLQASLPAIERRVQRLADTLAAGGRP